MVRCYFPHLFLSLASEILKYVFLKGAVNMINDDSVKYFSLNLDEIHLFFLIEIFVF